MIRKQFTFYRSVMEGICHIKNKAARCDAYDAIIRYALDGVEPDLDKLPDAAAMAFVMVKPNLETAWKKSEAGRKGGESKPQAKAKQTASNPQAKPKLEIEQDIDIDIEQMLTPVSPAPGKEAQPKQSKADAEFDRFWSAYPRKIGKAAAQKAFSRVKVPVDVLIAAVERQKESDQWTRDAGRYIPNAATWLNQGRWEDELPGKDNSKPSGQFQRSGQKLSPMMKDFVKQMMEEEA